MTLSKKHELLIFPEQNCPCVMILLQCDNVRGESWTRSGGSLTSTDGGRAFSPVLSGCTVQSLGCTDGLYNVTLTRAMQSHREIIPTIVNININVNRSILYMFDSE